MYTEKPLSTLKPRTSLRDNSVDKCVAFSYFRHTVHSHRARSVPRMRLPQFEVAQAVVARFVGVTIS